MLLIEEFGIACCLIINIQTGIFSNRPRLETTDLDCSIV